MHRSRIHNVIRISCTFVNTPATRQKAPIGVHFTCTHMQRAS